MSDPTQTPDAASSHDCTCFYAPGYQPKRCECGIHSDEHGDWCANENCRAQLSRLNSAYGAKFNAITSALGHATEAQAYLEHDEPDAAAVELSETVRILLDA